MKFKHEVAPVGCEAHWQDGNHTGARDHAHWLHVVAAEFLILSVISELPWRAFATCSMNVIPKSNYNKEVAKL